MLVYAPGGTLRHTFIRLDLEMKGKKGGIEGLLRRCVNLPPTDQPLIPKTDDRPALSRHKILPHRMDDGGDKPMSGSDSDDGYDD
jgi:hypothetical protein